MGKAWLNKDVTKVLQGYNKSVIRVQMMKGTFTQTD